MTEVIYNELDILEITPQTITELKQRALASPRKRSRLCMHRSPDDFTHEMLIVFHKDTFMPPHRHPQGKSESYHIIEGSMMVYFFDDEGSVIRTIEMREAGEGKPFLYRLSASIWHMPAPTSEWLVYHETYSGPFQKNIDVEFPHWAPKEHDKEQVVAFLESLPK